METLPKNETETELDLRPTLQLISLTDEEYRALEAEYKDYDFSQDEEWYSIPEFMAMITDGTIHWDWGGICRITVDGHNSNYHLGIWMLRKENEKSIPVTFYDLAERDETIMLEWASK